MDNGITDFDQNNPNQDQVWRWVDWSLNRTVDWRSLCGPYDPACPIPWGDPNCMIFTDYGYNNWGWGKPDNGGGGCDDWQMEHHVDENVGVFNSDGTWDDRALEHINWMGFIIEWDYIPNSIVIRNLFIRQYPDYQYPW